MKAASSTVGALRASGVFAEPMAPGTGTSNPKDALWQLAQLRFCAPLKQGVEEQHLAERGHLRRIERGGGKRDGERALV
jgi:hypothetical protein